MWTLASGRMILAMARTTTSSKVLLVEDRRPAGGAGSIRLRRYRLARLRFEARAADPASRFEHLKRVYE